MSGSARAVATSSVLLLVENVVRLTAVAFASFWIAKQLGPAQFGILNFASALMAIMLGLSTLGLDVPLILRLSQTPRPGSLLGSALKLRTLASLLVLGGISLPVAWLLRRDDPEALSATLIVSLAIVAYVPTTFDYWFKARTSAGAPALVRTIATLVSVAAKVACLLLGFGLMAIAWTIVLEAVITGLGMMVAFWWAARASRVETLSVDRQMLGPLLRESTPYLLSGVAVLLYMKVDVVMLGYLSTNAETGIYSLAQKISEVLYMVAIVLIDSAYPVLAGKFSSSGGERQHGQLLFDLAVGSSLLATVAALALASPLIDLVFGAGYEASIGVFYLHAWSCVAIAMNAARHRWLAVVGLQRFAPSVAVIGLIANVALNLVLIPPLGALGAAVSTVASYFISGYITSFWFRPLRDIGRMQTRALWPWPRLYRSAKAWHASAGAR